MRRRRRRHFDRFPPRSVPREAKGGIKAQTKKGQQFGQTWWAKRWLDVLESFDLGPRLARGRSYARSGQVLSIDIESGSVKAVVQGSRPTPYKVSIDVDVLSKKDWAKVVEGLASQAVFAAKLLAGEMPQDVEKVFRGAGLSLFPARQQDLETDCSCPDWSNPCKHIAAVYYLLGEEFDRDPFLLFRLRGMERDELLRRLGGVATPGEGDVEAVKPEAAEVLPADVAAFWAGTSLAADICGDMRTPPVSGAWLRRLGPFPFWRGERPLVEALEPSYRQAAERGLDLCLRATRPEPGEAGSAGANRDHERSRR
jgi:uncharacterized Zn finger protein